MGAREPEAETANAANLEGVAGRGPRNYGMVGPYVRIKLVSIAAFAVVARVYFLPPLL